MSDAWWRAIDLIVEITHESYFQRYGPKFGKVMKGAFTDEPSPGACGLGSFCPWTASFPEEFRNDHGYDLLPHLAHLAVDFDCPGSA